MAIRLLGRQTEIHLGAAPQTVSLQPEPVPQKVMQQQEPQKARPREGHQRTKHSLAVRNMAPAPGLQTAIRPGPQKVRPQVQDR